MRLFAALAIAIAFPAAAAAADDAQGRLDSKARDCVAASAPEVARVESNLSAAVDFLVNDLCARDIEVAGKYRLNRKVLDLLIMQQKPAKAVIPAAATMPPSKPADGPVKVPAADDKAQKAQAKTAALEAARISPETGEIEGLPAPYSMITDIANLVLGVRAPAAPADIRAFAARAVLAARQATR
jgi:hypothetical protein